MHYVISAIFSTARSARDATQASARDATQATARDTTPATARNTTPATARDTTPATARDATPATAGNATPPVTPQARLAMDAIPATAGDATPNGDTSSKIGRGRHPSNGQGYHSDGDTPITVHEPTSTIQARRGRFSDHRIVAVHAGHGPLPQERPPPNTVCQTSGDIHPVSLSSSVVLVGAGSSTSSGTNTADTLTAPICCPSDCHVDRLSAGGITGRSTSLCVWGKQPCSTQPSLRPLVSTGESYITTTSVLGSKFITETFRCDSGRDRHVTAAHLLCRPSEQHIRECPTIVFQSLRAGPGRAHEAIPGMPGSRRCNKASTPAIPVWGGGVGVVLLTAKFQTLWISVGAAVSAPVRLEVDDIATSQDCSVLPVDG